MMDIQLTISFEETPSSSDIKILREFLRQHNTNLVGASHPQQLALLLRDEEGEIRGGIQGTTSRGWLHISSLFVEPSLRGKGYGLELLRLSEQEALTRGCRGVYLSTYSFQSPEFYKKHGYEILGSLEEFPHGHKKYFMFKYLQP